MNESGSGPTATQAGLPTDTAAVSTGGDLTFGTAESSFPMDGATEDNVTLLDTEATAVQDDLEDEGSVADAAHQSPGTSDRGPSV